MERRIMENKLHCDSCGIGLGSYLYGKGGIEEVAHIFPNMSGFPDVVCFDCWKDGYSVEKPRNYEKVYGRKEFVLNFEM